MLCSKSLMRQETGVFFQVTNHGIPEEVIERFDEEMKRFFAKDKEEKYKIKRNKENSRGYFDDELTKQTRDWKECVDIGAQNGDFEGKSLIDGYNQWPQGDVKFKAAMKDYFDRCTSLSKSLLRAFAVCLGQQEQHFDKMLGEHTSYLRLNFYPPCPRPVDADFPLRSPKEDEGFLAINRHTDAGLLTILRQQYDQPHSLQVFYTKDSDKDHETREGKWVVVHPTPASLTINIGDMMQVCSNDKFIAPLHRVLANKDLPRYSAPYFFNPPYNEDCKPIAEDGRIKYRPVNWGEFRRRRFEGDFSDVGKEVQISDYRL
mmetsp:Transcript_1461/g.4418  ORF Transcript_1461/g.4418 Transcript_1461/m.4418 type:complete len:317 (-) Transcript_1461:57-1007(-)